jgi:hypothetical protein
MKSGQLFVFTGGPWWDRTTDQLVKSQMLYH